MGVNFVNCNKLTKQKLVNKTRKNLLKVLVKDFLQNFISTNEDIKIQQKFRNNTIVVSEFQTVWKQKRQILNRMSLFTLSFLTDQFVKYLFITKIKTKDF